MSMNNSSIESIHIVMFPDGRLDTKNAANYLGFKEKTLAMMRASGTGPTSYEKQLMSPSKKSCLNVKPSHSRNGVGARTPRTTKDKGQRTNDQGPNDFPSSGAQVSLTTPKS